VAKKSKSFFKDAGIKLNREIRAEQTAQASTKQSGFMKQLSAHKTRDSSVYTEAKAKGQNESLFRGQDVITTDKRSEPMFDNNLDKTSPTDVTNESPQGNFQVEQRVSLFRKGVK